MTRRVVVFGGTGFVGSRVMERLSDLGVSAVAASRSGKQPWHITKRYGKDLPNVEWVKVDAQDIDSDILKGADTVMTLIGSPPIPSLTDALYDHQILMNGQANVNVIDAAKQADVKRVVLLSASVPYPMRLKGFGYHQGKLMAREHLEAFTKELEGREGVVLKPGMIYGTRHTDSVGIPLTPLMAPVSCIHSCVKRVLPAVKAVDAPVSVDKVADALVSYALVDHAIQPSYLVLENDDIIEEKFAKCA
eukprot:TRINITY_DN35675_c0_g1_i1.p2 TRINITY_DN35675_c0_g1~~TRINITY_DN35675_c0_g1_i1.p2  ORF type:complete len:248 (+),score=86.72 TRINITY_DN35675_c0_g1_i1:91-834(+)